MLLNDSEVADPYFVTARVWSQSRADIPSEAFDSREPIMFRSDTPMIVTVASPRSDYTIGVTTDTADVDGSVDAFAISAQLIRREAVGVLMGVSEGKPTFTVSNSLVDIQLRDVSRSDGTKPRGLSRVLQWSYLGAASSLAIGVTILIMQLFTR